MAKDRVPTEAQEGVALSKWLTAHGIAHVHIPNGIKIGGDRRGAAGQIACLKDQGMSPGMPDYLVFPSWPAGVGPRGVAIELKRRDAPRGGQWGVVESAKWMRPEQVAWLSRLDELGWWCFAAAGAKHAISTLKELGFGPGPDVCRINPGPLDDDALGFGTGAEPVESVHMETNNEAAPTSATDADGSPAIIVTLMAVENSPLTSVELQKATGLDASGLRKALKALGGCIVKTGTKRGTRYALANTIADMDKELEACGFEVGALKGGGR